MAMVNERGKTDARTEERLDLLSVLQELTVAAFDLFDPHKPVDAFTEHLAERLGCVVTLWLETDLRGALQLVGSAGLSRTSRLLSLVRVESRVPVGGADLPLPYPELARPGLVRWCFPFPSSSPEADFAASWLVLYFQGEPRHPRQSQGLIRRLVEILATALEHRRLFARTIESERRLHVQKTLLSWQSEASAEGIVVISSDGKLLSFNRRCMEIWGLTAGEDPSREILLRAAAKKVVDPEAFLARVRHLDEHPDEAALDEIWLKDGRILERYSAPIRNVEGVLIGHGLYFRDVTDQRRGERALRRERDFTSAVLDTVGALVMVLDREGRIVRFNRACQRTSGHSFEEVRGSHFWDRLIAPEERETAKRVFLAFVAGEGSSTHESHSVGANGDLRRIVWASTVLRGEGGAVEHVISAGIDVTEQRGAEAERDRLLQREQAARIRAEEQEQRTAILAEASGVLAASLDSEDTLKGVARLAVPRLADWCVVDVMDRDHAFRRLVVAHANPAREELARELCQYPPDLGEQHGPGNVLRTGVAELLPEAQTVLFGIKDAGGGPAIAAELGCRSYVGAPLLARGRVLGAISLVFSESGRRHGPADLQLAQDLARRAALAVDNAILYREAQEAVGIRDEFLSVASHELKTPLTSLELTTQNALRMARARKTSSAIPEAVIRSFEIIERQGWRLTTLVKALLDVSRIHAGRLSLELDRVDLVAVAADVVARFKDESERAGTTIRMHADSPIWGYWDPSRVDQVLTNVLSNAIKYGAGKPIDVWLEAEEGVARLAVRDHGIGIPAHFQSAIFQRFARAVPGSSYGGLGLGLYIVRQLLEMMGATIRVESKPGLGSTFTIELPRGRPPVELARRENAGSLEADRRPEEPREPGSAAPGV